MQLSRRLVLGAVAGGVVTGCAGPAPAATPAPPPTPTDPAMASATAAPSVTPTSAPAARIAAASDLHYGEPDTDYRRSAAELVDKLNATHAATPLDLVVLNGDLTHAARWLAPLASVLADLVPPVLAVQGNHDGATEQQWRDTWGHGFDHWVDAGDVRVIATATSNPAGDYLCADVGELTAQLQAAGDAPVIVAMHITPRTWTKYGIDCPGVTRLLGRSSNVVAVLNGHDHDHYGVKTSAGVPYLFDGRSGGHWGTSFRGFRVLEYFPDGHLDTWVTDGDTVHGRDVIAARTR